MIPFYRLTKDRFYQPELKGKSDIKIAGLSDLHFSDLVTQQDLNLLSFHMKRINPDYIVVGGDNLDSTNYTDKEENKKVFYDFTESLGNIAPTIFGIGGHDYRRYRSLKKLLDRFSSKKQQMEESKYEWKQEFWDTLESIPNVTVATNSFAEGIAQSVYEDDRITIAGYTQPDKYYTTPDNIEDFSIMKEELEQFSKSLVPDSNKPSILLMHSPIYALKKELGPLLEPYNLIFSGHMHGGMVPPIFYENLKGNNGLVAPNKSLKPPLARGKTILPNSKTHILLSGGVVKIQACATPILHPADWFFPRDINEFTLTGDSSAPTESSYQYSYKRKIF